MSLRPSFVLFASICQLELEEGTREILQRDSEGNVNNDSIGEISDLFCIINFSERAKILNTKLFKQRTPRCIDLHLSM